MYLHPARLWLDNEVRYQQSKHCPFLKNPMKSEKAVHETAKIFYQTDPVFPMGAFGSISKKKSG
jgi:hypothetical protein